MKKFISTMTVLMLLCMLSGCAATGSEESEETRKCGMVFDVDQVKEDSFSWSSWKGMQAFVEKDPTFVARYLESREEEDILGNLELFSDEGYELIWGIGEPVKGPIETSAKLNKDVTYVLMDYAPEGQEKYDNLGYVEFEAEQAAFLAGYAAGHVTKTNQVGFVGGAEINPVKDFEKGYTMGVTYAADELKKDISVQVNYIGVFNDELYGREAAEELIDNGCDILFHAAGQSGVGMIQAAAERDCWAIGTDVDQYEEAPGVVLFSVLKNTKEAVQTVTERYAEGEKVGGFTFIYDLEDNGVGLTADNPNLEKHFPGVYEKTMEVRRKIVRGDITVPDAGEEE